MSPLDGAPPPVHDGLRRLAQHAQTHWGVLAHERRLPTLAHRLNRRVRARGFADLGAYLDFLFRRGGLAEERGAIIDAVTTRTTSFFREADHFEFLQNEALPEIAARARGEARPVRLWSAAASSGQEAYSIAIVCEEAGKTMGAFAYQVRATDISPDALAKLRAGVYPAEEVDAIPKALRETYFLRSRTTPPRVKVAPSLRDRVRAGVFNLISDADVGVELHDVIFIRNCLIYFDRETQLRVGRRLAARLSPGGYLITGHAEHFSAGDLALMSVRPTIHRKPLKGEL